jgi:hypothetical protein
MDSDPPGLVKSGFAKKCYMRKTVNKFNNFSTPLQTVPNLLLSSPVIWSWSPNFVTTKVKLCGELPELFCWLLYFSKKIPTFKLFFLSWHFVKMIYYVNLNNNFCGVDSSDQINF